MHTFPKSSCLAHVSSALKAQQGNPGAKPVQALASAGPLLKPQASTGTHPGLSNASYLSDGRWPHSYLEPPPRDARVPCGVAWTGLAPLHRFGPTLPFPLLPRLFTSNPRDTFHQSRENKKSVRTYMDKSRNRHVGTDEPSRIGAERLFVAGSGKTAHPAPR